MVSAKGRSPRNEAPAAAEGTAGGQGFEQGLARLEEIVRTLEEGDLSLEETVKVFEEGQALVRSCGDLLARAELRVQELIRRADGGLEERARALVERDDGSIDLAEGGEERA